MQVSNHRDLLFVLAKVRRRYRNRATDEQLKKSHVSPPAQLRNYFSQIESLRLESWTCKIR